MQSRQPVAPSIMFRLPADHDFAVLAEIRRDARMQSMLMAIPERSDDEAVKAWIDRRLAEPGGMFRVIASSPDEAAFGFIQINSVNVHNRYGYGAVAILERCGIPGVAMLAMRELMRFARQELGLAKLMAEIRADNAVALRMNALMGYKVVGTLEQHFADQDYHRHDVVLLEKGL